MTCIVGIAKDGSVFMGGDSAAVDINSGSVCAVEMPKVFIKDEYLIGYSGSFRMGKFLQYTAEFPKPPSWAKGPAKLDEFMNGYVVPALRKQAKEAELEPNEKEDFGFLIGIRGSLFELDEAWAAYENSRRYAASGSGTDIALGSLYATNSWTNSRKRIQTALEASALHNAYVQPPFTILEV